MSTFTSEQAISAGLKTELLTTPTLISGSYKLSKTTDSNGKFNGYAFVVNQNPIVANSISGEFESTEEFITFAKDLKNSGATLQLENDFPDIVQKYTAEQARDDLKLIYAVRSGDTSIEGRYEISQGVIKIFQKKFEYRDIHDNLKTGAFETADDLIKFLEDTVEDLKTFDQVKTMRWRKNHRFFPQFFRRL